MTVETSKQSAYVPLRDAQRAKTSKQSAYVPLRDAQRAKTSKQSAFVVFLKSPSRIARRRMPLIIN